MPPSCLSSKWTYVSLPSRFLLTAKAVVCVFCLFEDRVLVVVGLFFLMTGPALICLYQHRVYLGDICPAVCGVCHIKAVALPGPGISNSRLWSSNHRGADSWFGASYQITRNLLFTPDMFVLFVTYSAIISAYFISTVDHSRRGWQSNPHPPVLPTLCIHLASGRPPPAALL